MQQKVQEICLVFQTYGNKLMTIIPSDRYVQFIITRFRSGYTHLVGNTLLQTMKYILM